MSQPTSAPSRPLRVGRYSEPPFSAATRVRPHHPSDDLRLFATTFAAAFVFVSLFIA